MTSDALKARTRKALSALARRHGISRWHSMTKPELVRALLRVTAARSSPGGSQRPNGVRAGAAKRAQRRQAASARDGRRDLATSAVADLNGTGRHNYLDAQPCGDQWVRLQWDLTRDSILRAQARLGAAWHDSRPVVRVFSHTSDEASIGQRMLKDVPLEAGHNTWFVHVPAGPSRFRFHIGYKSAAGTFFAVAKSNVCQMPRLAESAAAQHNGKSRGAADGSAAGPGDDDPPRLGRPLGFSTLSHFGPGASQARRSGVFTFRLETELIIHGTTLPGSQLAVQGEPVELRDDGSFTLRVMQPEGRQVIAFTALDPRGHERRMVVLGVERNTKELERQYFDGGHADGGD